MKMSQIFDVFVPLIYYDFGLHLKEREFKILADIFMPTAIIQIRNFPRWAAGFGRN